MPLPFLLFNPNRCAPKPPLPKGGMSRSDRGDTPDELLQIFEPFCEKAGYKPSEGSLYCAYAYFKSKSLSRSDDFANARTVRNFFEQAITNQANRLASDPDITDIELCELLLDDVKSIL